MAITIVATAGSGSANSFVTEAEQIAYMAARLNASAWTTVTGSECTETEKKAMVEATRELSSRTWIGERADTTQVLSWPRQWAVNPDSPFGYNYSTTEIPQRVKDAACELAFQFLKSGTTDVAALDSSVGIRSKTVGPISTEYEPSQRPQGLRRFPRIWNYISPLLANGSGISVPLVRG